MAKNNPETIDMEFDGKKFTASDMDKYTDKYSKESFFDKVTGAIKKAGLTLIY